MNAPILVPLDGSPIAERALPYAVSQAKQAGSSLLLVRAETLLPSTLIPMKGPTWMTRDEYQREFETLHAEAEAYLNAKAAELQAGGMDVAIYCEPGYPIDVIVNAARKSGATMIVMTTHGRSGLKRWYFGSVAEEVLRHSPVPILLVREQEAAQQEREADLGAGTS